MGQFPKDPLQAHFRPTSGPLQVHFRPTITPLCAHHQKFICLGCAASAEVGGEAVSRARSGEGPSLIEAQTYRYEGHFGADNTLLYRTEEEEALYRDKDCIEALKTHLLEGKVATEGDLQELNEKALEIVNAAVKFADESPFPGPEQLYEDVYVSYP